MPVERSTERSNGIFTTALASWDHIQNFARKSVELGIVGLNQVRAMNVHILFSTTYLRRSGRMVIRS